MVRPLQRLLNLRRLVASRAQTRFDRWILYLCICSAFALAFVTPLLPYGGHRPPKTGEVSQIDQQSISLYKDNAEKFSALAIAIAGAATVGAYNRWANRTLPPRMLRILRSCWTLAGLSIFSGALGLYQLQRVTQMRLINTDIPILSYPALVEVLAAIAAVPFLVSFLLNAFSGNNSDTLS